MNYILHGNEHLPIWAIIIRITVLYLSVIVATHLMGKRQVGIISGHNYLVAAGLVSIVAVRMVNPNSSLVSALVIVLVYALINRFWSFLDLKYPHFVDRRPISLMENGYIILNNLAKAQISLNDLLMVLRQKKIWNLTSVHQLILEPNGQISVLKKHEESSVSRKDLGLQVSDEFNLPTKAFPPDGHKELPNGTLGYVKNPNGLPTFIRRK